MRAPSRRELLAGAVVGLFTFAAFVGGPYWCSAREEAAATAKRERAERLRFVRESMFGDIEVKAIGDDASVFRVNDPLVCGDTESASVVLRRLRETLQDLKFRRFECNDGIDVRAFDL